MVRTLDAIIMPIIQIRHVQLRRRRQAAQLLRSQPHPLQWLRQLVRFVLVHLLLIKPFQILACEISEPVEEDAGRIRVGRSGSKRVDSGEGGDGANIMCEEEEEEEMEKGDRKGDGDHHEGRSKCKTLN